MKSKNLPEKILRLIKSKGFNNIELDPVLETKYILQRSGENFKRLLFSFYDINGKEIVELINSIKNPGIYEINFNAKDMVSGIYFYQLSVGGRSITKKMSYVR